MVSQPSVRSSGTGQYTERLVAAFPDNLSTEKLQLPVDSANPLSFIIRSLDSRLTNTDVVHIQFDYVVFGPFGLFTLLFFPLVAVRAQRAGVPLVVTLHETLGAAQASPPLQSIKQWYLQLLNLTVSRSAAHLVFLSEASYTRFTDSVDIDTQRVSVLSHGVPEPQSTASQATAKRCFDVDPEAPLVVAPGYVSPRKGSDIFVDTAERLPTRSFLLAGGAPRQAHADFERQLAEQAPANCTVTGQLPEDKFHAAFVAADLIVLPYRETEQRGIINPVSQSGVFNWAAAYEVPVLASDCQHFRTLAEDWGVPALFTAGDSTALAKEVTSLLDDMARRETLTDAIAAYRSANSLRSIAASHCELYRSVSAE